MQDISLDIFGLSTELFRFFISFVPPCKVATKAIWELNS